MLYSINWPNFIVWLPLLLEISGNVYCKCFFPSLWHQKFWNLSLLSDQPFSYVTKKSEQNLKTENSFLGAIKSIFYHFQRYSAARNFLRSESAPLTKCRRGCFFILLIFFILRQLPINLSLLISNIYICYPIGFILTTFISESFLSFHLFHADERFYVFAMKASGLRLTFSWLTP